MRARSNPLILAAAAVGAAGAAWGVARLVRRQADPAADAHVAYPPLDVPKPFADGVWIVDSGPISAMGLVIPVRMTIVRLADGGVLLHAPTQYSPALAEAVTALGPVVHLVAPNVGHWMFLADWQRAFPDATTWAAPGLRDRAQVRAAGLRIDAELTDTAPPAWADVMDQGIVRGGGGFSETWFLHRASRTLILVDLLENLEPAKLTPATRWVMRAAAATDGTTARYLRLPVRLGGADARRAIAAVVALEPERVIFAHGKPFDADGAARLRRGFAWLLPAGRADG